MTYQITDMSPRKAARVAGFGLLCMTIFAFFAVFFIFPRLVIPEDAAATVGNIMANELLFRIGICSLIIVIILDVVVAWALYVFLKPIHRSLSLCTAWFRLVYAVIFGAALANCFNVLHLLSGADYLHVLQIEQLHQQVMMSFTAFNDAWAIGYVFFGLHLAFLGYLVFKSGYIPKLLGILLLVAGAGYLVEYFGKFLFPDLNITIGIMTGWGELLFMIWLLWKGGKVPEVEPQN